VKKVSLEDCWPKAGYHRKNTKHQGEWRTPGVAQRGPRGVGGWLYSGEGVVRGLAHVAVVVWVHHALAPRACRPAAPPARFAITCSSGKRGLLSST